MSSASEYEQGEPIIIKPPRSFSKKSSDHSKNNKPAPLYPHSKSYTIGNRHNKFKNVKKKSTITESIHEDVNENLVQAEMLAHDKGKNKLQNNYIILIENKNALH